MNNEDNHTENHESLSHEEKLIVNTESGEYFITISKILFITANAKHSNIFLTDSEHVVANHMLNWFRKQLPGSDFYRCHHSAIVNCKHVLGICGNSILVKGGNRVPLSRFKRRHFKDFFLNCK